MSAAAPGEPCSNCESLRRRKISLRLPSRGDHAAVGTGPWPRAVQSEPLKLYLGLELEIKLHAEPRAPPELASTIDMSLAHEQHSEVPLGGMLAAGIVPAHLLQKDMAAHGSHKAPELATKVIRRDIAQAATTTHLKHRLRGHARPSFMIALGGFH